MRELNGQESALSALRPVDGSQLPIARPGDRMLGVVMNGSPKYCSHGGSALVHNRFRNWGKS